jgi:hypothetical protein
VEANRRVFPALMAIIVSFADAADKVVRIEDVEEVFMIYNSKYVSYSWKNSYF